jgi:hypothetical protein
MITIRDIAPLPSRPVQHHKTYQSARTLTLQKTLPYDGVLACSNEEKAFHKSFRVSQGQSGLPDWALAHINRNI